MASTKDQCTAGVSPARDLVRAPESETDAAAAAPRTRGYLPHWEHRNAIYFVTFRLADSLPRHVRETLEAECVALITRADERHHALSSGEQQRLNVLLSQSIQQFLDAGAGACLLSRPEIAQVVVDALHHFDRVRYTLLCWCIMPNHVHVVFQPLGSHSLSDIVQTWKSFTAKAANRILRRTGKFWQREYYDHIVRSREALLRVVRYVAANPRSAHLRDWQWVEVYEERVGQE